MTFAQRLISKKLLLCAIASAFLWWLSLQQIGLFALGWIALTPVLWACGDIISARSRFFYGWRAGFLCFLFHNWWLLPTITKSSVMIGVPSVGGALLGVLAVGLIAAGHGLGVAILASAWNPRAPFFRKSPFLLPVFAALLWLVFDWARCQGELAHSWGALAYSQWRDPAFLQIASLIGQHGLSALCLWLAASFALWLRPEYSARVPNLWRTPIVILVLLHVWGGWKIWRYDHSPRETMRVFLVQTNATSLTKSGSESQFEQAERLTREYSARGVLADLIVWPETSAELKQISETGFNGNSDENSRNKNRFVPTRARHESRAAKLASELNAPLLLGAQVLSSEPQEDFSAPKTLSNRAVLFGVDGKIQSRLKNHVVPFGERAPFGEILPFLNSLAPEPPVEPGNFVAPLDVQTKNRRLRIGTAICFESCFGAPARELRKQGAGVLLVLTNDEWFAGTNAPWEHAAMSTLRAVENGMAVAQSANGGHSFAIDGCGRFLAITQFGQPQILDVEIPLARE